MAYYCGLMGILTGLTKSTDHPTTDPEDIGIPMYQQGPLDRACCFGSLKGVAKSAQVLYKTV